jgi:hypothetical protein
MVGSVRSQCRSFHIAVPVSPGKPRSLTESTCRSDGQFKGRCSVRAGSHAAARSVRGAGCKGHRLIEEQRDDGYLDVAPRLKIPRDVGLDVAARGNPEDSNSGLCYGRSDELHLPLVICVRG